MSGASYGDDKSFRARVMALGINGATDGILLKRAVAQGVKLGRPKIDSATERKVRKQLAKGLGILKAPKSLGIGTGTVQRISNERAMSPRGAQQ
jgi:DNA invertase Pin-like site-specific DNA recombinase